MHRLSGLLLRIGLAGTVLAASVFGVARAGPEATGAIHLRAGSFDPLRVAPAELLRGLPEALQTARPQDRLFLIQFQGPPLRASIDELRQEGAVIFDYVPEHAYLARVPPESLGRVLTRPFVRAVVPYLPALRVDPELTRRAAAGGGGVGAPFGRRGAAGDTDDGAGMIRLLVQAAPDQKVAAVEDAVARAAAPVARVASVDAGRHTGATLVEIEVADTDLPALLPGLASLPEVLWVEERRPFRPHNGSMRWVLQTGAPNSFRLFSHGLTGAGQLIGESDTGVDVAHCFFVDPAQAVSYELVDPDNPPIAPVTNPAHRKILSYQYHSGSNTEDQSGHGTHTAGTAAGDDLAHPASGLDPGLDTNDGMAPGAKLVFQDIDRAGGFLDVPANLYGLVQAAYNAGARLHTNSWGSDTNTYTSDSEQVDRFTWDHPDMLFFFSAGNDGPNAGSINAPATAKNVVTVGMTETPAAGDPNNLVSGSSNGPTSDGRLKPDVTNVGGFPVRSAAAGTACGIVEYGGTSMATPGVAGGAALLRQYLADGFYPHGYPGSGPAVTPSAALLKAAIVNSAINMTGANVDAPIPDGSQGWGRVILDNAAFFVADDRRLLILKDDDLADGGDGFAAGAVAPESFQVFNCRTDVPLKITLAWSDAPVAATSGQAWVNDLDLEVIAPDGTLFRGNVFAGGASSAGGAADPRNNVEQVLLRSGSVASGLYTVRVVPTGVAVGPQPYALLATGDISTDPLPRLALRGTVHAGGCDGDPYLDEGETLTMSYTVANPGCADAGPFTASLSADTTLPVTIAPADLPVAGLARSAETVLTYQVSLAPAGAACGTSVPLRLRLQAADGSRWEIPDSLSVELDPAGGTRTVLDDVEGGDRSVAKAAAWAINTCAATSPTHSWHLGQADCTGIPQDAAAHDLEFAVALAPGESLATASFKHAFDGYMNANFTDSVRFEIDHDLDGTYDPVASWTDTAAPKTMTAAGPFDLSAFNAGRSATVRFRFRFQSGANWVGGPNSASGWNVDDFTVNVSVVAACDASPPPQPPGNVGATLLANRAGADLLLSWAAVPNAAAYRVLRSETPDLASPAVLTAPGPSFTDPGAVFDPRPLLFFKVFAVNSCGTVSQD